jgi:hypothetical protein
MTGDTMPIEPFDMERMQSTWENIVDYDMSESGVRPLTLRELVAMGFDLDAFMDQPLGYSQSNGTIQLRDRIAAHYPGATIEQIEVTNGTSEANYLIALSQLQPGDEVAMEVPNYMQMPGVARSLGATVRTFRLRQDTGWEPDWDEFERVVTPKTKLLYLSNPNNPTGAVLSDEAMARIVGAASRPARGSSPTRCTSAPRSTGRGRAASGACPTASSSRAGCRRPTASRASASGGWSGRKALVHECWTQHDYLTIGPNKMSDRIARVAVQAGNREALLRADARHPAPQPADRPRVGRLVRRAPDLARAAGRRHRPDEIRRGRPEPRDRRTGPARISPRSSCPAPTWGWKATSGSGSGGGKTSCAKACGGSASSSARCWASGREPA